MLFPERELEIIRLAEDVSTGLLAQREDFPAPPAPPDEIDHAIAAYNQARDAAKTASATAARNFAAKEQALSTVVELIKADVKYAESMVRGDQAKLQALGWNGRRKSTIGDAEPGQVITLEVAEEGKTWITLEWKAPFDGGPVSAYRVQRRKPGGEWSDVGTSLEPILRLNGQESGVEFEYQVLAINKVGAGPASNIVRAVL